MTIARAALATATGIKFGHARARTWIGDSMIRPDQTPIAPAVGNAPSQLTLMTALVLRGPQPKDDAAWPGSALSQSPMRP
jgi:hypothetical protein